jgi:hypothetical protein
VVTGVLTINKLVAPAGAAGAVVAVLVAEAVWGVQRLHQDRVVLAVWVQLVTPAAAAAAQLKLHLKLVEPLAVTGGQANTIH